MSQLAIEKAYRESLDCVHCGLCLPVCPTYRETGQENSSPRGRIYLVRGVAEKRIPLNRSFAEEMNLCLGCRACETACPSGVKFGALLEESRHAIQKSELRKGFRNWLEHFALAWIVPHPRVLRALFVPLRWIKNVRLDRLVGAFLPASLRRGFQLLPDRIAEPFPLRSQVFSAVAPRRGRVALFSGCVMTEIYSQVHRATIRVLNANGFEVVIPKQQRCCGALHVHAGKKEFAEELLRRNASAFSDDFDAVILNSAGCGAALRDGNRIVENLDGLESKVRDVCEFLDEVGWRAPLHSLPWRVAYDDPCHLLHGQGVDLAPRNLLQRIPGLRLLAHRDADRCCGGAGSYQLTQPTMSQKVLDAKLDALEEVDPSVVATGNPGCLMQIAEGVRRRNLAWQVLHPIEILAQALMAEKV